MRYLPLTVLALAGAAHATEVPVPAVEPTPESTVAFYSDPSARLTLPIAIGGKGPYRFLVDTGSERTILSQELAAVLALQAGKPVRLLTVTGSSEVGTVTVPTLDFGKQQRMKGFSAPLLRAHAIGAVGLLGIDSLEQQQVIFDFKALTMSMSRSRPSDMRRHDPDEIVVTARKRLGRLVLGEASVERQRVEVVLDTGAELTIGNEALRRKLIERRKLTPIGKVVLTSVTGEPLTLDYGIVRDFALGNVRMKNVRIAFGDVKPFAALRLDDRPAVLLGMETLKLFSRVSVDFANRRVRFQMPGMSQRGIETQLAGL
ncbi:retroviral-like aspartic protease family protein [Sphingomonas sp. ID0503]|uniref:retroviral-like aspartic protease family protein n=1 Tax=Sphingomonas sp. ID0503 TaxID=3399691 RepID=UPI003AFB3E91